MDMKHLNREELEAIGMKNSTENIVKLVLKGSDGVKAAPPESEAIDKSYMEDNSLNNINELKSNDLHGVSGE